MVKEPIMSLAKTFQINHISSFSGLANPTFHWLGKTRRLRALHFRDRLIPWQIRHFYYHHETEAQFAIRLSLGIMLGQLLTLVLQVISDLPGLSLALARDVCQASAMLVPGLSSIARRINLPRGKVLYQADQPAEEVMLLIEGYGRLCIDHGEGRSLTVGLVAPGDLFGEEALLDIPERESNFEAVLQSQIDIIPRKAFTSLVNDNPALLRAVTIHLAQRLLTQQRHMARLAFEPLEKKLAWTLLELTSATKTLNNAEPDVPVYHKDLASMLGVWRETITATLIRWANDGLITQHAGHITLKDIGRLEKMADDATP